MIVECMKGQHAIVHQVNHTILHNEKHCRKMLQGKESLGWFTFVSGFFSPPYQKSEHPGVALQEFTWNLNVFPIVYFKVLVPCCPPIALNSPAFSW